ncbi:MAG: diaminopimelate epimerase [Acidobacteria bacterium]|nr:MAG: diaminopimelate epimerase [Acidobacteriota bacterium]
MNVWPFWKMTGAGNDFVVGDDDPPPPLSPPELARRVCARRSGIGADGLLLVGRGDPVRVRYWNADGSEAAFCGNGARCAALYAVRRGRARWPARLVLGGHEYEAAPDPRGVRISVDPPARGPIVTVRAAGALRAGRLVTAGVPHVLFESPAVETENLAELRGALAAADAELAARANLTVYAITGPGAALVRTLERGSGETLACGSAALAVAAVLLGGGETCRVVPPSGLPLFVRRRADGRLDLAGEARLVYRGEWLPGED